PTPEMKAAIIEDLMAATDPQAVGDMVSRLNSAQPGFRTLMSKTISALGTAGPVSDLAAIDPRWERPQFWVAIVEALSPLTDRNLLAAVDMGRDTSGALVPLPEESSANLPILLRTFWIAAIVTLACAAI